MKEIVKTWSSGETYNKHRSKRLSTDFCLLTNSQKGFGDYSDLGNCISFVYDNVLPLEYSVIEDYNPLSSIEKGNKLCKSVGSKESEQEECSIYIAKEGDSCESIAESFPSLTAENIEQYSARNSYFYGSDNIIEGDRLCVSKSHT